MSTHLVEQTGSINTTLKSQIRFVAILLDDSTSMRGNENAVYSSLQALKSHFTKLSKLETHVVVAGLHRNYCAGEISTLPDTLINMGDYVPNGGTPLYTKTAVLAVKVKDYIGAFKKSGDTRPFGGGILIVTDAEPTDDEGSNASNALNAIRDLLSMKIKANGMFIGGNESSKANLTKIGIPSQSIFLPGSNEREIRHAFDMFSQSFADR